MMDDRTMTETNLLHGHNGPVYSCSFTKDKSALLSCSQDGVSEY